MKILLATAFLLAVVSLTTAIPECQWGPSYWCHNQETAQKCGQLQYCQQNVWKLKTETVTPNDDLCDICKLVVGYVDKYVENNATEAEAETALKKFCSDLGSLATECDSLVENYFPEIWKLLVGELDPDKVCTELKLCTSTSKKVEKPQGLVECEVCKIVVKFADKYIDSNATEAEAEAEVEKLCSILGSLQSECDSLVQEYFPLIWKYLQEETDPDTICTLIGLCSSATVKKVESPEIDLCDVCKLVVGLADQYLADNKTMEFAEKEVERVCTYLGGFAAECKSLLDEFFPMIWKYLEQEMSPEAVCTAIGVCKTAVVKKVDGVVSCEVCKLVVKFLDEFVEANKTESEAKAAVEEFCSILGPLESECKDLVDMFFSQIWADLVNDISPTEVCVDYLKLCSSAELKKPAEKDETCDLCKDICEFLAVYLDNNATEEEVLAFLKNLCQLIPEIKTECDAILNDFDEVWKMLQNEVDRDKICYQYGLCTNSTIMTMKPKAPTPKAPKQTACTICKTVVNFLQTFVDENSTEAEVENAIDEVCKLLPSSISAECEQFVKDYFPIIWGLVKSEFNNDEICFQLKLCTSVQLPKLVEKVPKAFNACSLCKAVISFIRPFVDANATEGEVKSVLEEFCKILPSTYKTECNNLIKEDFDLFWMIMKQEVDDGEACALLKFCPSSLPLSMKPSVPKLVEKVPKACNMCSLCEQVVCVMRPYVDSNATKGEVKSALEEFCTILDSAYKMECNSLIKEDFDMYWMILKQEVDNGNLCAEYCPSSRPPSVKPSVAAATTKVDDPETILCTLCELVMEKIDSLLVNNATETEIIALIEKICTFFPESDRKFCDEFIQEYGKKIIEALVDGYAPKIVCTIIHLCLGESAVTFSIDMKSVKLDDCSICEFALEFVKEIVGENSTKEEVLKVLVDICSYFPSALQAECKAFVEEYGFEVVQLIDEAINPKEICQTIGLCPKTSRLAAPWKMLEKAFPLPKN